MVSAQAGGVSTNSSANAAVEKLVDLTADPEEAYRPIKYRKPNTPYMYGGAKAPSMSMVGSDLLDQARMIAVIDTNYFITHLPLIKSLSQIALQHGLVLIVPWIVIQELDGLKLSKRAMSAFGQAPQDVSSSARAATRFLEEALGRAGHALRCQKRSEYIRSEEINDDQIIDCCLYFMENRGLPVAILSEDRSVNVKALANGCAACGEWTGGASGLVGVIEHTLLDSNQANGKPKAIMDPTRAPAAQMRDAAQRRPIALARPSKLPGHRIPEIRDSRRLQADKAAICVGFDEEDSDGLDSRASKKLRISRPTEFTADSGLTDIFDQVSGSPVSMRANPTDLRSHNGYQVGRDDFGTSAPLAAHSPIVIYDSDDDMDVDMDDNVGASKDNGEDVVEVLKPQIMSPPLMPRTSATSSDTVLLDPHSSTDPYTSTGDIPATDIVEMHAETPPPTIASEPPNTQSPVIIYLDESPIKNNSAVANSTALDISADVVTYIRDSKSCGLNKVVQEQLKKKLGRTYAESWTEIVSTRFAMPPWHSTTTILTVILYYWDNLSQAFHRRDKVAIRRVLPWVMKLENVTECPLITQPLPPDLRFQPIALLDGASEAEQIEQYRVETVELIQLANSLLSQCALAESEDQEKQRHRFYNKWSKWMSENTSN
ncbi:hypothetical protein GGI07_002543 [Coemansia sp. Benny D115]|nr:hypothetical protein GGI07_002543 [Coemansia sp. Benny D115]